MINTHKHTDTDTHKHTHTHTNTHPHKHTQTHTTNTRRKYHILISDSIFPFSFPFPQLFRLSCLALLSSLSHINSLARNSYKPFNLWREGKGLHFIHFLEGRERPSLYSILTITRQYFPQPGNITDYGYYNTGFASENCG